MLVIVDALVHVAAELVAQCRLVGSVQQIDAQPGRADGVDLGDEQVPAVRHPLRRPRKRECDQQAQQRENRGFDGGGTGRALIFPTTTQAYSPSEPDGPNNRKKKTTAEPANTNE